MGSTYLSDNQEEVLNAVRTLRQENNGPVRTSQVREQTGKGSSHTSDLLGDLVDIGELVKLKRGIYDVPEFVDDVQSSDGSRGGNVRAHVSEWPIDRGEGTSEPAESSDSLQVDDRLIRSYVGYVPSEKEAFFCQIEGDSMQPWLSEGEFVFALRTKEVTVPGRYIVWWGKNDTQMCVHLSPLLGAEAEERSLEEDREGDVLLTKYSPRRTLELRSVSEERYEMEDGSQIRMQIQGRVVWPTSDPQGVMETVTDQMGKIMEKAIGA